MKRRQRTPDLEKVATKYIVDAVGSDFSAKMAATVQSRNFLDFMEEYEQQEPRSFGVVGHLLEPMGEFGNLTVLTDGSVINSFYYNAEVVYPGIVLPKSKLHDGGQGSNKANFFVYFENGLLIKMMSALEEYRDYGSSAEIAYGMKTLGNNQYTPITITSCTSVEYMNIIGLPRIHKKFLPHDFDRREALLCCTYMVGLVLSMAKGSEPISYNKIFSLGATELWKFDNTRRDSVDFDVDLDGNITNLRRIGIDYRECPYVSWTDSSMVHSVTPTESGLVDSHDYFNADKFLDGRSIVAYANERIRIYIIQNHSLYAQLCGESSPSIS